jgi:hypothetical protein
MDDKNVLLQQRTELAAQLRMELNACRATRRKIAAIDLLLEAQGGRDPSPDSELHQNSPAFESTLHTALRADRREKNVMQAIRQIIENARGAFTARTLVEAINRESTVEITERDVSHPLWKLRKLGVIKLYKKGSGRRPSVYLKA